MRPSSPVGSSPTPDFLPSLSDILRYFTGAMLLMAGKRDGLKRLDLSVDGFWNSFSAILVALPPTAIAWLEFERSRQLGDTSNMGPLGPYVAHALADATAWLFPLLVLILAARPLGLTQRIVALVVAMNWANALLAWAYLPVWLVLLVFGAGPEGSAVLALALLAVSVTLTVRVVSAATAKDLPASAGIVGLTVLCALMAYAAVADLTGLSLA